MKAGRELDARVAEKVFDRPPSYYDCPHFAKETGRMLSFCICPELPRYSEDIAAAWEVVEKMAAEDTHLGWSAPGSYSDEGLGPARAWSACFGWPDGSWHNSECAFDCETACMAICLAAFKVKGVEHD